VDSGQWTVDIVIKARSSRRNEESERERERRKKCETTGSVLIDIPFIQSQAIQKTSR
jgi:hypothetical protein